MVNHSGAEANIEQLLRINRLTSTKQVYIAHIKYYQ